MAYKSFMGRVTREPELKTTQSGKRLARFCIAVSRYTAEDEADFVDCVAWEEQADLVMQHFSKGMAVCVSGAMKEKEWQGRDGAVHTGMDLQVKTLYLPKEIQTYAEGDSGDVPW